MRIYDSVAIVAHTHAHRPGGVNFIPCAVGDAIGYRVEPHDGGPSGFILMEPDFDDLEPRVHLSYRYDDTSWNETWPQWEDPS